MAINRLTPQDAHVLMNALVAQATGQTDIEVVDASTFVSAGEKVLATGYENTLNALSVVLGRTIVAVRPYQAKLKSIQAMNTGEYTHRLRKISYYARNTMPAGNWNTNLYPLNLATGRGNGRGDQVDSEYVATKSMWVQNQPVPFEMNFSGHDVWQDSTTVYREQLKVAFRSEDAFGSFVTGIMTEKANDLESQKEAFNRLAILQKIGQIYASGTAAQKINLTSAFNEKFGTNYTSAELRSTYLKEFLAFFVSVFKLTSDRMTERSVAYHQDFPFTRQNPETGENETLHILRHTPKADQKALLYNPLFVDAQAQVLPQIFNPQYLNIENFESVDYWQSNYSEDVRPAVNVIPAVYDTETGKQIAGSAANIPYVVGMIFDRDALVTDYQFESADTTPIEARKHYYNIWWSFSKNVISDPSENAVLFYMDDGGEEGSSLVGQAVVGTAIAQ